MSVGGVPASKVAIVDFLFPLHLVFRNLQLFDYGGPIKIGIRF